MLLNPFTPSEIASSPDDFYGRSEEIKILETSLKQGSVAIFGGIGIGKSSLLARTRLLMEGFNTHNHKSKSIICIGDKNVKNIDESARMVLERFITVDEKHNKINFKLGSLLEIESAEICRYFSEGRHLAIVKRLLEEEYFTRYMADGEFFIIAIDEADKCPIPLAQLIRSITTHTQQQGVKGVRFLLAGVNPYFNEMIKEDQGINRFFYRTLNLQPMSLEEAEELLDSKLQLVVNQAKTLKQNLRFEPEIIRRVAEISGGHPHLLQLLGSHLIEHEDANPDDLIDRYDLIGSLKRICYEDRVTVYDSMLHSLDLNGKIDSVRLIVNKSRDAFPTRISRKLVKKLLPSETIQWLLDHNILSTPTNYHYGFVDELLRVRMIMDSAENEDDINTSELKMIEEKYDYGHFGDYDANDDIDEIEDDDDFYNNTSS